MRGEVGRDAGGRGDGAVVAIDADGLIGLGLRQGRGLGRGDFRVREPGLDLGQPLGRAVEGIPAEGERGRGDGHEQAQRRDGRQGDEQATERVRGHG